jgi:Uma2 family endonuclease
MASRFQQRRKTMTLQQRKSATERPYPTSDGKPMAETDIHRDLMVSLIQTLKGHFVAEPNVYVSGNLLVFYVRGNRRKHVSPDVFVVRGVANHLRDNYLIWEEGKGPEAAIELTSSSTRHTDTKRKMALYRDVLKVKEYFLFDPYDDYLVPRFQGYRLRAGDYVPIQPSMGRMTSQVLGLELMPVGDELRLYDPVMLKVIPTPLEQLDQNKEALRKSEYDRLRAEAALDRTEAALDRAEAARLRAEAEIERLRQQPGRHGTNGGNGNES